MQKAVRVLLFIVVVATTNLFASETDLAWLNRRVKELQPKPEEKRFDEIGWARDIRDAERIAAQNQRPVFLFTHDGRMNLGRC